MAEILSGIRVLELAQWIFVPSAAALLADLGADVIKVEHPEFGDPARGLRTQGLGGSVNLTVEQNKQMKKNLQKLSMKWKRKLKNPYLAKF